jgi:ectoine hydroxylase-related dioxygenase (phytanoyl-CoA dioxygenase family)
LSWLSAVHNQGFAIVPGVLTSNDLEPLMAKLSDPGIQRGRAGVRHAMRFPCVSALARDNRLLGLAKEVLGASALPFKATVFDKSSTANWLVVWHQDTALPLKHRRYLPDWGPWSVKDGVTYAHAPASALNKVLALRVHFDDSTAANGPLRVLPGTHVYGVLTDEAIHDLSSRVDSTECLVPRGGVLAMRPLIVHSSSKSKVQTARRVLHIEYATTQILAEHLELEVA